MVGYEDFVKQVWGELQVEGWKGYVLKEKFKGLKVKLKEWNKDHCGNLESQIKKAKEELSKLDLMGEVRVLTIEEEEERRLWA